MRDYKVGNIIGWAIAIGFVAIYFGFWNIPVDRYISYITMAAALYAAGTSYDIHKKIYWLNEELNDLKKDSEKDLNIIQEKLYRIENKDNNF